MFLGVTSFSIIYRATKGWTELFNTGAGLLCFTVGVFTLISGIVAERKLKMARAHVDSEQQMRDAFNLIDEYGEGKLPSEKIYDLLAHFDPPTVLTDGEHTECVEKIECAFVFSVKTTHPADRSG